MGISLAALGQVAQLSLATLLALALGSRGYKKGSLSRSGAVAAAAVGFVALATSLTFGAVLLGFYFTGSKLTAVGKRVKQSRDFEVKDGQGQRSWEQVLATAGIGTVLAAAWYLADGTHAHTRALLVLAYLSSYATACGDTWASEGGILASSQPRLVTTLFWRSVPHGTNGGMTLLGTALSAAGGAFIGLLAVLALLYEAALSGLCYWCAGASQWLFAAAAPRVHSLTLQNLLQAGAHSIADALTLVLDSTQEPTAHDAATAVAPSWSIDAACVSASGLTALQLILFCLASGIIGSLIDSLMGAVLQRSWQQVCTGRVTSRLPHGAVVVHSAGDIKEVDDETHTALSEGSATASANTAATLRRRTTANGSDTSRHTSSSTQIENTREGGDKRNQFRVICGYDIVSNEAVNLLSALVSCWFMVVLVEPFVEA